MNSTDSSTETVDWTEVVSSADSTTTMAKTFYHIGKAASRIISAGNDVISLFA